MAPGGRPRLHEPDGRRPRRLDRPEAALREHEHQRDREPALPEPGREPREVPLDHRLDIGVGGGGGGAMILADLGGDLRRQGDRHPGQPVARAARPPRARRRGCESCGAGRRPRPRCRPPGASSRSARRSDGSTGRSRVPSAAVRSASPNAEPPRDERLGPAEEQVVEVVPVLLTDGEAVDEAGRRHQADPGAGPLDQRVGHERRGMDGLSEVGPARPLASSSAVPPARIARPGSSGVVRTFSMVTWPPSSTSTTSVKVPPTSTAEPRHRRLGCPRHRVPLVHVSLPRGAIDLAGTAPTGGRRPRRRRRARVARRGSP